MFGLENKKNDQSGEFFFDLEVEIKDPEKLKELKKLIETRIQSLKAHLRSGENKDDFVSYGFLLHGYASLLKVIQKAQVKKK